MRLWCGKIEKIRRDSDSIEEAIDLIGDLYEILREFYEAGQKDGYLPNLVPFDLTPARTFKWIGYHYSPKFSGGKKEVEKKLLVQFPPFTHIPPLSKVMVYTAPNTEKSLFFGPVHSYVEEGTHHSSMRSFTNTLSRVPTQVCDWLREQIKDKKNNLHYLPVVR